MSLSAPGTSDTSNARGRSDEENRLRPHLTMGILAVMSARTSTPPTTRARTQIACLRCFVAMPTRSRTPCKRTLGPKQAWLCFRFRVAARRLVATARFGATRKGQRCVALHSKRHAHQAPDVRHRSKSLSTPLELGLDVHLAIRVTISTGCCSIQSRFAASNSALKSCTVHRVDDEPSTRTRNQASPS